MARYKEYDYNQMRLLPVSLPHQLMPGTLEFAIHFVYRLYPAWVMARLGDEEGIGLYLPGQGYSIGASEP